MASKLTKKKYTKLDSDKAIGLRADSPQSAESLEFDSVSPSRSDSLQSQPPVLVERICKCCCPGFIYNRLQNYLIDTSSLKTTKETLIYEKCITKMVDTIIGNSTWVNATLFSAAITSTMHFNSMNAAANAWIIFITVFVLGIILAILPRTFENVNEMKRELEILHHIQEEKKKKQQQNNQQNDEQQNISNVVSLTEQSQQLQQSQQSQRPKSPSLRRRASTTTEKILNFIEVEVNELGEKFEDLFIPSLSNLVALALNTAGVNTVLLLATSGSSSSLTAAMFYALFVTIFGVFLTVRLGSLHTKYEKDIIDFLSKHQFSSAEEKKHLLLFAFRKRCIKLTESMIGFTMAYAWRTCINSFILVIYGNDKNSLPHTWTYTVIVTIFVGFGLSIAEHFYILYPKNLPKDGSKEDTFLESKARLTCNGVFYNNFRFVVGMAWFDAITKSLQHSSSNVSPAVLTFIYWLTAFLGLFSSVICSFYIQKLDLHKKIENRGFAQAVYDAFERMYDPKFQLHQEGDHDFLPMILDTSIYTTIECIIFGWGIAGSMGVTNAVKFSISESTAKRVHSTGLLPLWIVALVGLFVTTLITAYFSRIISGIKKARKKLMNKFKKSDDNQRTLIVPTARWEENDDEYDDDMKEEKKDNENDVNEEEMEQKVNENKDVKETDNKERKKTEIKYKSRRCGC